MGIISVPERRVRIVNLRVEPVHGALAKSVAEEVNAIAREEFEARGVSVLDRPMEVNEDGYLTYASIHTTALANRVLKKMGEGYVATRWEKESDLEIDKKTHEGIYSHDGHCFGGFNVDTLNRDSFLAGSLVNALRNQGGEWFDLTVSQLQEKVKSAPLNIQYKDLDLQFVPGVGAAFIPYGDISVYEQDFNSTWLKGGVFNKTNERGVPILGESGTRTLYANSGNSRGVYLDDGLDVDAGNGDWSDPDEHSRVVRTVAEGDSLEK